MSAYVRPSVDAPVCRDGDGQVIDYGTRWAGSPPEDTYSVDTHPERFAPVHTVAGALIDHLCQVYDVESTEGVQLAADLLHDVPHAQRAVRINPRNPACAALTFVFTDYPGIVLHAGLLHDFYFPSCGCDACDSTWEAEAQALEETVLAVVTGQFRETIRRRSRIAYELNYPGGTRSGWTLYDDVGRQRFDAAAPMLRRNGGAWSAWPSVRR